MARLRSSLVGISVTFMALACGRLGFDYGDVPREQGPGVDANDIVDGTGGVPGTDMLQDGMAGAGSDTAPCLENCVRVSDGLILKYAFDEGDGLTVHDSSDVAPAVDLSVTNGEAVTWNDRGLLITDPVSIESETAASKIAEAVATTNEISLEAWLAPEDLLLDGPARILSVSANEFERNFSLLQQGPTWNVRLRTDQLSSNGITALRSAPIVRTNRQHLLFTHESDGSEKLYVDGQAVSHTSRDGEMTNWDSTMRAIVGAEFATGLTSRNWQGQLELLAVYERALTATEVEQNFLAGGGTLLEPCAPDCNDRYSSALSYENFEGEAPLTWSQDTDASAEKTTAQAHSGEASMVFLQGEGSEEEVRDFIGATDGGHLFARAWVYVPSGTVTSTIKLMAFIEADGDALGTDINIEPDGQLIVHSQISSETWYSATGSYPYDQWFCLQAAVRVDDFNGAAYAAVDGITHVEASPFDTLPSGGVDMFVYGLAETSDSQTGGKVFFDDVVLDTQAIPCK